MLLLQYLILAVALTLIIKRSTMHERKPWIWALLLLGLVILAENLLRNVIPTAVATLIGAASAFLLFFLVKFTPFKF